MHLQEMPTAGSMQKTAEPFRTKARGMPGSKQLFRFFKRQITNTYAHETMSDCSFLTTTRYVSQCRNTPCSLHSNCGASMATSTMQARHLHSKPQAKQGRRRQSPYCALDSVCRGTRHEQTFCVVTCRQDCANFPPMSARHKHCLHPAWLRLHI